MAHKREQNPYLRCPDPDCRSPKVKLIPKALRESPNKLVWYCEKCETHWDCYGNQWYYDDTEAG